MMRANGERFEAEITARPAREEDGRAIGFVSTLRDVSVQKRYQRELERLARTDSLTKLANRHVLQEALTREAARRSSDGQQLALVLLDLDLFKQVNDGFGHPAGDAVLVEVARRLERHGPGRRGAGSRRRRGVRLAAARLRRRGGGRGGRPRASGDRV